MKKRLLSSLITGPLVVVCMFVFSGVAAGDTVYVDPSGSADFTTIQAAIDDVGTVAGDVVIVMPGTYVENINMSGKAITLRSTDPLDGSIVLTTIIDGGGAGVAGTVITCDSAENNNTVINGFLITNGYGNFGGGMYNEGSSPTVSNCTFSGNVSAYSAMFNYDNSSPTVSNCTFIGNIGVYGGGMCNHSYSPAVVSNCTFSGNRADNGGGMYNESSSAVVTNCTFSGNTAYYDGGGMWNWDSSPTVSDCVFSGNTADNGSGGGMWNHLYFSFWFPVVNNCTFSGNTATVSGGGMYTDPAYPGAPKVSDTSFCINTPNQIDGPYTDNGRIVINDNICPPPRPLEPELEGDLDGDGDVDFKDFAILANNWLEGVE